MLAGGKVGCEIYQSGTETKKEKGEQVENQRVLRNVLRRKTTEKTQNGKWICRVLSMVGSDSKVGWGKDEPCLTRKGWENRLRCPEDCRMALSMDGRNHIWPTSNNNFVFIIQGIYCNRYSKGLLSWQLICKSDTSQWVEMIAYCEIFVRNLAAAESSFC